MYRKEPLLNETSSTLKRILPAARFLSVSLLAFLLLGPMIRTFSREVEKPIILLAVDESRSIVNRKDSSETRAQIRAEFDKLKKELSADFDVRSYAFGDHVSENPVFRFDQRLTDFSQLYNYLDVQFSNRNVGAMVIASDGLFNEGASPVYGPSRLKIPVYSLALGDTTIRRDLFISSVNHNKIAFLGNSFPLEIIVDARQAAGRRSTLSVEEDSSILFSKSLDITGNNYHLSVPVFMDAKTKGIHHYRIKLSPVDGEATEVNNTRDIFVEVIEQKQKVLLLFASPNPDVSAIRQSLESSLNYEVITMPQAEFTGRAGDFNLVVLHNLPSGGGNETSVLEKINESGVSAWYILGSGTNIEALNKAGAGISISQANGQLNDVQASLASNFSLFTLSDALKNKVEAWPPLKSPFGVYQAGTNIYPLFNQKIGIVSTAQPLLFFHEQNGRKVAVLAGEGLWRWRLADFNEQGNHQLSQELIWSITQYLSVKENRSPFKFKARSNYRENEPLVFDAQLYNQSDQLINQPEVFVRITNRQGKEFQFTMSKTEKAYTLNSGIFPVGNYRFKAEVKLGDQVYSHQGEFSVSALQLETANTVADHQLLNALAAQTGAAVFYPGKTDELIRSIQSNENLKSISFMHKKLEDLLNEPWFFILLVVLISTEWFIRKRTGSY
ncbi:MAG: hypothetical protein JNL88_05970 [Bacteroidia bacterium]|nr:hypothetical protein [Bacteroidia bacterium]